jgi:hypothetical protein
MTASSHRARTAWPVRVCGCTGRPAEGTAVRDRPLPFSRRAIGSTEVLPRGLAVTKPPNFPRNENKTRARGDRSDRALFRARAGRLGRCAAAHLTRLANGNSNLFASRIPRQDHGDLPDEPRDADLWQYDHRFVGRLAGARWAVADGRGRRPLDGRDSPGAAASALHSLSIATTKGSCWISRFELGYRLAIEPRLPRCVRLDGA